MDDVEGLVRRAQAGDVDAFGHLVRATQRMAYAVARSILRDRMASEDALQQSYLQAFRRLSDLHDPATFPSWLRRIVVTVAISARRTRRVTLLRLDDAPEVPVLDDAETSWSEEQRMRLASALLTLSPEDRQLCERRYYGRWTTARLGQAAGVDEAVIRKRLQRLRDKLRKET
jgi:RNA polymerase sigma-70 factor (ECF subfamily)